MSHIIYCVDTETTGLEANIADVIEVSCWRNLPVEEQRTWCIKPINLADISEKALKVNGHKLEDLLHSTEHGKKTYREASAVVPEIESWILQDGFSMEDRVFIGQNPDFDVGFLKALWRKAGSPDSFPFGNFVIDTIMVTRLIDLCTGIKRERYNLASLVKAFSVTKDKAHSADGDVRMTKDLFFAQLDPIKEFVAKMFAEKY